MKDERRERFTVAPCKPPPGSGSFPGLIRPSCCRPLPPALASANPRLRIGLPAGPWGYPSPHNRPTGGRLRHHATHVRGAEESVSAQDHAVTIADRLARKAPHLLWLLVVVAKARQKCLSRLGMPEPGTPRIAALTVDCRHVLLSDAETITQLGTTSAEESDVAIHSRWVETLGSEAISRRFFQALQGLVTTRRREPPGRANFAIRRDVALLHMSRLLFLAFLEERSWLDGDRRFLARVFDGCMATVAGSSAGCWSRCSSGR